MATPNREKPKEEEEEEEVGCSVEKHVGKFRISVIYASNIILYPSLLLKKPVCCKFVASISFGSLISSRIFIE